MNLKMFVAAAVAVFGAHGIAQAQIIERPVAFDSAGRVMVITPETSPALGRVSWPVGGNFRDARLYSVSDSTYILVVTRTDGTVERYPISAAARREFAAGLSAVSAVAQNPRIESESRNAFIRNQTLVGLLIYGPAAAAVVEGNSSTSTATYLLVSGGTFFAASEIARRIPISPAQNELATHGATRGALGGAALIFLAGGESKANAFGALAGGVAGTALGLHFAKNMLEGEAAGTGFGADFLALTTFGLTIALGERCENRQFVYGGDQIYYSRVCDQRISERAQAGITLAAGLVGYPLGYRYAHNAGYNVTAGDIGTLWTTGILGGLAGAALVAEDNAKASSIGSAVTAGFVGGVLVGDRFLVRTRDHTRGDAALVGLGAAAGGLMGAGVAVIIDDNDDNARLLFSFATLGGIAGLVAGERFTKASPDAGRRVSFSPENLILAGARVPGKHPFFQVKF